jgi:hypothetical protein
MNELSLGSLKSLVKFELQTCASTWIWFDTLTKSVKILIEVYNKNLFIFILYHIRF